MPILASFFRDTVEGQILNVFPGAVIKWGQVNLKVQEAMVTVEPSGFVGPVSRHLLVIEEDNILRRRPRGVPGAEATWRLPMGAQEHAEQILEGKDGVVVCYGWASEGGEIEQESQGNQRKGSYRRLAYVQDVQRHSEPTQGFHEITTTFTERNIRLFMEGRELEDRSDYEEGVGYDYSDSRHFR